MKKNTLVLVAAMAAFATLAAAGEPGPAEVRKCYSSVAEDLKDPDSAKFPAVESAQFQPDDANGYRYDFTFRAKNSFGGYAFVSGMCTFAEFAPGHWMVVGTTLND